MLRAESTSHFGRILTVEILISFRHFGRGSEKAGAIPCSLIRSCSAISTDRHGNVNREKGERREMGKALRRNGLSCFVASYGEVSTVAVFLTLWLSVSYLKSYELFATGKFW